MAPPAMNGPVDWTQRAPPPSAGGVNTTGPGQFAPSAGNSQMPNFGARDPQYANLLGPIGRRAAGTAGGGLSNLAPIGRILDPAGIGRGNLTNLKGGFEESVRSTLDPAGVFGGRDHNPKDAKGVIDPETGTVTVKNYGKNNAAISAAMTEFLRTGVVPPSLKHAEGAFKDLKRQIKQQQATGGPGGGAWQWGTPSAGAPTVIPGQGPINWGNGAAPPPLGQAPGAGVAPPAQGAGQLPGSGQSGPGSMIPPQAGATPPPAGSPAPGAPQVSWTKPPQLPSPAAYNPQAAVAAALRKPTGGGSKLVGGYQGP